MHPKDALGRFGEDLAVRHLESQGCVVVERNWRCARGEIDIVARDGGTLIICEVKTRRSTMFGAPVEAVTPRKLRRLRSLALAWITEHGVHAPHIRLDVIGVLAEDSRSPIIHHVRGA